MGAVCFSLLKTKNGIREGSNWSLKMAKDQIVYILMITSYLLFYLKNVLN